jgi:Flp pilus assembly protein TadD
MSVLGAANYRHGDYESAIISLQRAQELRTAEDDYPEAWNLLYMAMAHQQQGSGALARAHYNAAMEREAGGPTDATLELEARTLLGL